MEKLLELIIEAIKNGDYVLISMVTLIFILIWFYNEFRKSYIINKSEDKLDIEKVLEQYSKLYFGIMAYQLKDINSKELFNYINQAVVYLPKKNIEQILELDKNNVDISSSKLESIKNTIKGEINSIKSKQFTLTTHNYKKHIFEEVSWFLSRNNYDSFFHPLLHSFFTFIGVLFVISISISIENLPEVLRISATMFLISLIFSGFYLIHLINLIINKEVKLEFLLYFLLIIVLPLCLTIFLLGRKYTIINTITIIIFMYLSNKRKLTRPKNE